MHPYHLQHLQRLHFLAPLPSARLASSALLLLASIATTAAQAQTVPDAGSLQREAERSLQTPRSTAPTAQTPPAAKPMAQDAKATRVTVRSITIEGASLIALEELNALLAHHIGQSLTLAELEHAAQTIAEHYRRQGWYARVYLPQQDVTDGSIRGPSDPRVLDATARAWWPTDRCCSGVERWPGACGPNKPRPVLREVPVAQEARWACGPTGNWFGAVERSTGQSRGWVAYEASRSTRSSGPSTWSSFSSDVNVGQHRPEDDAQELRTFLITMLYTAFPMYRRSVTNGRFSYSSR